MSAYLLLAKDKRATSFGHKLRRVGDFRPLDSTAWLAPQAVTPALRRSVPSKAAMVLLKLYVRGPLDPAPGENKFSSRPVAGASSV
jgi:hypothetical protein